MQRVILATAALFILLPPGHAARADGMMMPSRAAWNKFRERAYINEPEQKAVVYFRGGQEDLIISPGYSGSSAEFAWVVPVPARPKVKIVEGALFHELARLCFPEPPRGRGAEGKKALTAGATQAVRVIERKTVGAYDVSVLEASDGRALMKWLAANGYHLPEKAVGPVQAYVKERWTFVACRIKDSSSGAGLRTGTLAPLRLTFAAKQPVYPMRLSSANPQPFRVLIYLLLPAGEVTGNVQSLAPFRAPVLGSMRPHSAHIRATLAAGQEEYPTLAKLGRDTLLVLVQEERHIRPEFCTQDFVWALPGRRSAQAR
jgi:hypothetical protein